MLATVPPMLATVPPMLATGPPVLASGPPMLEYTDVVDTWAGRCSQKQLGWRAFSNWP